MRTQKQCRTEKCDGGKEREKCQGDEREQDNQKLKLSQNHFFKQHSINDIIRIRSLGCQRISGASCTPSVQIQPLHLA